MSPQQPSVRDIYVDSCLRVEHERYFLAVKGTPVKLTRTEFRIVSFLVSNIDRIATREELWSFAWGNKKPLNCKSIHVFLSRVRRKLEPFGLKIAGVVDVGYILSHGRCCSNPTQTTRSQELNSTNSDV